MMTIANSEPGMMLLRTKFPGNGNGCMLDYLGEGEEGVGGGTRLFIQKIVYIR